MTNSWSRERDSAQTSAQILVEVLEDPSAGNSRLIHAYLDAKRQLARAFRVLAIESIRDGDALDLLVSRLEDSMAALYPAVPTKYREVRGFASTHRLLYAYLMERLNANVSIDELRVLTADAVHTERRLRELRRLGLEITMIESGGFRTCQLSPEVDLGTASREWVLRAIAEDKTIDDNSKMRLTTIVVGLD